MTGNIAIDVVIGLIFIYTLYSLLCTIVVEFLATIFQLRARNLQYAITRMLTDENSKELAKKFFETPLIKNLASGRKKIFGSKKFPSYIQPRDFADAVIYLLKFDSDMQAEVKDRIEDALKKYKNTETGKFLLSMLEDADYNISKYRRLLEHWFNDTMERASGWYKKNITYVTLIVGFIIAMAFNIDTFKAEKQLSKDPEARKQYLQLAGNLVNHTNLTDKNFDPNLRTRLLNDYELRNHWGTDTLGFKNFVDDSVYKSSQVVWDSLSNKMKIFSANSNSAREILSFSRTTHHWYIFDSWMNFLGCLITAIALSLGAPFWFDLLNKFIQLRTSMFTQSAQSTDTNK